VKDFISLLAMYGLTFLIKESYLLSAPRNFLSERTRFFRKLFSCPYCIGFHSGWMVYFLANGFVEFSSDTVCSLLIYSLAGITISGFLDNLLIWIEKLAEGE